MDTNRMKESAERLQEYYTMLTSRSESVRDILFVALAQGVTVEVIESGITQTAMAPKPTKWYLRSILLRYIREGVYTGKDLERDTFNFYAARRGGTVWMDKDGNLKDRFSDEKKPMTWSLYEQEEQVSF